MQTQGLGRLATFPLLAIVLTACTATASPWRAHDATADLKVRSSDPTAECPVVFSNATDELIEAGYLTLGVESSVGLIPSGHSLRVAVLCKQERIEAFAVAERGASDRIVRYRKMARLNLAQVTHLDITAADRVH